MDQWGVTDAAKITAYLASSDVAYKGGVHGLKHCGPAAAVNFIPRRFYDSTREAAVNSSNLGAALARQGADNFGTRVWWDTKPTAAPTCS
jgi:hypothetical protein